MENPQNSFIHSFILISCGVAGKQSKYKKRVFLAFLNRNTECIICVFIRMPRSKIQDDEPAITRLWVAPSLAFSPGHGLLHSLQYSPSNISTEARTSLGNQQRSDSRNTSLHRVSGLRQTYHQFPRVPVSGYRSTVRTWRWSPDNDLCWLWSSGTQMKWNLSLTSKMTVTRNDKTSTSVIDGNTVKWEDDIYPEITRLNTASYLSRSAILTRFPLNPT